MREIRTSGSEGGGAEANRPSLPLSVIPASGQGRGFAIADWLRSTGWPAFAGHECVREFGLSARWESMPCEVTAHVDEGNCVAEGRGKCVAPRRGGEQPEANGQPVG